MHPSANLKLASLISMVLVLLAAACTPAGGSQQHKALTPGQKYVAEAVALMKANYARPSAVDWAMLNANAEARASTSTTAMDAYPAVRWALGQLPDHYHSIFLAPTQASQYAGTGQLGFAGWGFTAARQDGRWVIVEVIPASAADAAGLKLGDLILSDGKLTPAFPDFYLAQQGSTASTTLTVLHLGDQNPITVRVASTPLIQNYPHAKSLGRVGYVALPSMFAQNAETDFAYAVNGQQAIAAIDSPTTCGWIVDLRLTQGGVPVGQLGALEPILGDGLVAKLTTAKGFTEIRLDHGSMFASADGKSDGGPFDPAPYQLAQSNPPVAVLSSPLTGSGGELAAIAFSGRPLTRSFGQPTAGRTTGLGTVRLSDGAAILISSSYMTSRTGKVWVSAPVVPQQTVEPDWGLFQQAGDPAIAAATAWLADQEPCSK